jgi:PAS domain S-box-containing protein
LPDNPIVYASQGFLNLTGYSLDQILGRNCRFLQGPETDPKSVERIRKAIDQGNDMSVCLLNYRVDGTTFWNQFFIAALRDQNGNVTNFVGVQCKGKYSGKAVDTDHVALCLTLCSPLFSPVRYCLFQCPTSTPVSP